MEKINSKKVGNIIGAALAVFLLAMVMQPVMAGVSAEITGVELNGQGDFIEVAPGEVIEVEVFFKWMNIWSPQEALDEIVVGFEGTPIFCVVDTIINNVPGYDSGNIHNAIETFEITAPTEPGTYCIYMTRATGSTCGEAKVLYQNALGLQMIADFDVIGDEEENEKWVRIYYEDYTIKFSDTGEYGRYSIAFYQHPQHHNELQMEIDTWERHGIWGGSVSMSVKEDVWIDYHTGKAWGIHLGETDFREIDPNPSNAVGESFFKLIMGFIPYAGLAMNLVDCGEALSEPKGEFDVYDEVDHTGHFKNPSKVFNTTNYLNDRDVVIIAYPCGPILAGKTLLKVDFPRLEFQKQGINDVVFCIDGTIFGNVRHYIALPIEIGKQAIPF